jgi:methionyl-tRNA synthetase
MPPGPAQAVGAGPDTPDTTITIDDFAKVQLKVAQVLSAERVPKADKLLHLKVSLGDEERTVLAGVAEYYEPETLVGRKVVMITNLAPRKMRGLESQGMLLAAEADGKVSLLQPDQDLPPGAAIR